MNQSELEKTQLEIAKLQLEQERLKLAQAQRRHDAVGSLGQGAAAAGGMAAKGGKWLSYVALCAIAGCVLGACSAALAVLIRNGATCPAFPGADLLYRIGCALGTNHWQIVTLSVAGALYGAYQGHKIASAR